MIYERQAQICKAFANPARLKILDLISKGECGTEELQDALRISRANLSQHMSVLKSAGIIAVRREGNQIYYSLAIPEVKQACLIVRKVLHAQIEGARRLLA